MYLNKCNIQTPDTARGVSPEAARQSNETFYLFNDLIFIITTHYIISLYRVIIYYYSIIIVLHLL